MSIFVPPRADPDLLRSLRDIEQQLNDLTHESGPAPATDTHEILSRLDVIESRLNSLTQFERAVQPPADYKNDGNPSRVLHEDGTWLEPLRGIAKAVPTNLGSSRTRPTSLINVLGSMAVTGAVSAHRLRARRHDIRAAAAYVFNSANIAYTATNPLLLTFDTVLYDTVGIRSTTARLAPPADIRSGYWYIWGSVRFSSHAEGAGPWHSMNIQKNSAGTSSTPNILCTTTVRDGSGQVIDMNVATVAHLNSSDHVELYVIGGHNDTVTAIATTQSTPGFGMVYLGA